MFEVGDEVEVVRGCFKGRKGIIADLNYEENGFIDNIVCSEDGSNCNRYFDRPENLKLIRRKGMYKQGDVLVRSDGREKRVLGVCGDVYLVSDSYSLDLYGGGYTKKELDGVGYTLKTDTDIEITVKLNGKPAKLKDISDETLAKIKEAE